MTIEEYFDLCRHTGVREPDFIKNGTWETTEEFRRKLMRHVLSNYRTYRRYGENVIRVLEKYMAPTRKDAEAPERSALVEEYIERGRKKLLEEHAQSVAENPKYLTLIGEIETAVRCVRSTPGRGELFHNALHYRYMFGERECPIEIICGIMSISQASFYQYLDKGMEEAGRFLFPRIDVCIKEAESYRRKKRKEMVPEG